MSAIGGLKLFLFVTSFFSEKLLYYAYTHIIVYQTFTDSNHKDVYFLFPSVCVCVYICRYDVCNWPHRSHCVMVLRGQFCGSSSLHLPAGGV